MKPLDWFSQMLCLEEAALRFREGVLQVSKELALVLFRMGYSAHEVMALLDQCESRPELAISEIHRKVKDEPARKAITEAIEGIFNGMEGYRRNKQAAQERWSRLKAGENRFSSNGHSPN